MASAEAFRSMVVTHAGGACEYCRLLQDASGVTFHIEHILPTALGNETAFDNLALSCPGCNLAKANRVSGTDFAGKPQSIFNPRSYEPWLLGWHLHFSLDCSTGRIVAKTRIGEATIQVLNVNSQIRAFARKLQINAGLIA